MTIRRVFDELGRPNYRAWRFVCDDCGAISGITGLRAWWIPVAAFRRTNPEPLYCPSCAAGFLPIPLPARRRAS